MLKNSIIGLTLNKTHQHAFEDNLCLFRFGLVLHFGVSIHGLEGVAKRLEEKLEEHTGNSYDEGLELSTLATVEFFFKYAINVYSLQEGKTDKVIRLSKLDHDVMHVNLNENNFSYIKKFSSYVRKCNCSKCGRILNQATHLKTHPK